MRQLLYKDPAVFFAGVLATQLPGYLSPLYWAVYPVFASFVAAGPLTCMMDMKPGFGSAAIFPVLWFIVYRCMGELGMPVMWVICFTFIIVIALSIVMASVSERLTERIIAGRKNSGDIYVKQ